MHIQGNYKLSFNKGVKPRVIQEVLSLYSKHHVQKNSSIQGSPREAHRLLCNLVSLAERVENETNGDIIKNRYGNTTPGAIASIGFGTPPPRYTKRISNE